MNDKYVEKLVLLERILHDGVEKLLTEARSKDCLELPYGRKPNPTPLITEDQFLQMGGLECDDEDPEFKFDYGFDPLKILSDYIMWAHPETVETRRQEKLRAAEYLVRRAKHSQLQLAVAKSLSDICCLQRSGILWGPFSSPIDGNSIVCVCKPLQLGVVTFQISETPTFQEIVKSIDMPVQLVLNATAGVPTDMKHSSAEWVDSIEQALDAASAELLTLIAPVKVQFDDLKTATKYYIRCCLKDTETIAAEEEAAASAAAIATSNMQSASEEDAVEATPFKFESDGFNGVHSGHFASSIVWTLPSEDSLTAGADSTSSANTSTAPSAAQSVVSSRRQSRRDVRSQAAATAAVSLSAPSLPAFQPIILHCFGQLPLKKFQSYCSADHHAGAAAEPEVAALDAEEDSTSVPQLTCLLGDLLEHRGAHGDSITTHTNGNINTSSTAEAAWQSLAGSLDYMNQLSTVFGRCSLFCHPKSPLRTSSFLFAWRDGSLGGSIGLRVEELAHKQFRHEFRKWNKKFGAAAKPGRDKSTAAAVAHVPAMPSLKRPPHRDSVQSVLLGLPVSLDRMPCMVGEIEAAAALAAASSKAAVAAAQRANPTEIVKACRMMYRSLMMGPDIQLIVLDMRGGEGRGGDYLGKEQAAWLQGKLNESLVQWKIIMCGKAAGVIGVLSEQQQHVESATKYAATAQQHLPKLMVDEAAVPDELVGKPFSAGAGAAAAVKQVQLQEPDKAHMAAVEEDLDELYGRSLCSLQHVLALHEQKVHVTRSDYERKLDDQNPPATIDPARAAVRISSGVVVVSSGLARMNFSLTEESHAVANAGDIVEDTVAPAFIASYSSYNGPPLGSEDLSADVNSQRLPARDKIKPSAFQDMFCAEVCLGCLPTDNSSNNGSASGGDGSAQTAATHTFCYRDGVSATTIFSALVEERESGVADKSAVEESYCKFSLVGKGNLCVELHSAADAISGKAAAAATAPVARCIFSAPTPAAAIEGESEI